jgi:hypothetical protein
MSSHRASFERDPAGCTGIMDVSALGHVQDLILYGCTGITDVSALGQVQKLDLAGCTGITDVHRI